jgi:hypothetical protein
MEIAFRQVHSAAAFSNERVRVRMFTPGGIEFKSRTVGNPHCRKPGMVQRSRKLIQPGDAPATQRNQTIDSDIENARRLAQAQLQSGASFYAEIPGSGE